MPYGKKETANNKWVVFNNETNEVMGSHSSENDANSQLFELYTSEETIVESEEWKKIDHYVHNHPIYGDLPEEEIRTSVAALYEKHCVDDLEQLNEYVDMYMHTGGGWGPNASGLAYSTAGRGSSGGTIYGYGGTGGNALGGKSRQGTRVYGYSNTNGLTPGQGVAPIGGKNGDPAMVVISKKDSNYKPWEVEMTNNGYRKNDIERNKTKRKQDELWGGPLGDVVRAMEDYGYDIEQINDMTQEELEDTIIKILKKEREEEELNESRNLLKTKKLSTRVLNEMFSSFSDDEDLDVLEEKKRQSKVQDARELLASKHSMKKAIEKVEGGRAYIIDRDGIEKIMRKYGYVWDETAKKWRKKGRDVEEKKTDEPEKTKDDGSPEEDDSTVQSGSSEDEVVDPTKHSSSDESIYAGKTSPLDSDPLNKIKIKEHQARYILAISHDMPSFVVFEINDETGEQEPTVASDTVLMEMDKKQYEWDSDKMLWNDPHISLPDSIFEIGDSKSSVIARSILSAFGDTTFIELNQENEPQRQPEAAIHTLEGRGFNWNEDVNRWEFVGEDNKPQEQLNENRQRRQTRTTSPKNLQAEYGYSITDVSEMTARFSLRAQQLYELSKGKNPEDLEKNPVEFNDYPNTTNPTLKNFREIKKLLEVRGYEEQELNQIRFWSTDPNKPSEAVEEIAGDDLQSFIGRSILATADKSRDKAKYVSFSGDPDSPNIEKETFETIIDDKTINNKLSEIGFVWSDKSGWFQRASVSDKDDDAEEDLDLDSSKVESFRDEYEVLRRYQNAKWGALSYSDRRQYKKALGNQMARRALGISKKDWPTGSDPISALKRKNRRDRMGIYFKFNPTTMEYEERPRPVSVSGGWVDIRAATGNILRTATQLVGASGGVLGTALRALSSLTY